MDPITQVKYLWYHVVKEIERQKQPHPQPRPQGQQQAAGQPQPQPAAVVPPPQKQQAAGQPQSQSPPLPVQQPAAGQPAPEQALEPNAYARHVASQAKGSSPPLSSPSAPLPTPRTLTKHTAAAGLLADAIERLPQRPLPLPAVGPKCQDDVSLKPLQAAASNSLPVVPSPGLVGGGVAVPSLRVALRLPAGDAGSSLQQATDYPQTAAEWLALHQAAGTSQPEPAGTSQPEPAVPARASQVVRIRLHRPGLSAAYALAEATTTCALPPSQPTDPHPAIYGLTAAAPSYAQVQLTQPSPKRTTPVSTDALTAVEEAAPDSTVEHHWLAPEPATDAAGGAAWVFDGTDGFGHLWSKARRKLIDVQQGDHPRESACTAPGML